MQAVIKIALGCTERDHFAPDERRPIDQQGQNCARHGLTHCRSNAFVSPEKQSNACVQQVKPHSYILQPAHDWGKFHDGLARAIDTFQSSAHQQRLQYSFHTVRCCHGDSRVCTGEGACDNLSVHGTRQWASINPHLAQQTGKRYWSVVHVSQFDASTESYTPSPTTQLRSTAHAAGSAKVDRDRPGSFELECL